MILTAKVELDSVRINHLARSRVLWLPHTATNIHTSDRLLHLARPDVDENGN